MFPYFEYNPGAFYVRRVIMLTLVLHHCIEVPLRSYKYGCLNLFLGTSLANGLSFRGEVVYLDKQENRKMQERNKIHTPDGFYRV